jgi:hypothetical protein
MEDDKKKKGRDDLREDEEKLLGPKVQLSYYDSLRNLAIMRVT